MHTGEELEVVEAAANGEEDQNPDPEAEVADPVGQEGLLARIGRRILVEEEADQQITRQPHQLPEYVEKEQVAGQYDAQH